MLKRPWKLKYQKNLKVVERLLILRENLNIKGLSFHSNDYHNADGARVKSEGGMVFLKKTTIALFLSGVLSDAQVAKEHLLRELR